MSYDACLCAWVYLIYASISIASCLYNFAFFAVDCGGGVTALYLCVK